MNIWNSWISDNIWNICFEESTKEQEKLPHFLQVSLISAMNVEHGQQQPSQIHRHNNNNIHKYCYCMMYANVFKNLRRILKEPMIKNQEFYTCRAKCRELFKPNVAFDSEQCLSINQYGSEYNRCSIYSIWNSFYQSTGLPACCSK